jgi:hypothetical protein
MRLSLPVRGSSQATRESPARWLVRHAVVVWLLIVEPVSLALTLDRALPRMPSFGFTAWTLVVARIALAGIGLAVAGRMRTREEGAWRAVSWWACASIGATLLARVWPELPTGLAPSEARLVAAAAIVRDGALALAAAWLARGDAAADADRAATRDSS